MSATTHPVSAEEIMALLDGELASGRAPSVSAHIASCAECRQIAASLANASQLLAGWAVPGAGAALRFEDCLARAAQSARPDREDDLRSRLRKLLRLPVPVAWGAAALVLFVVFAIALGARRQERTVTVSGRQAFVEKGIREALVPLNIPPLQKDSEQRTSYHDGLEPAPMIARAVSVSIVVKDFDAARASLDAVLARHRGYAANLSVSTPRGTARALQGSLRIPAPELEAALRELRSLGRVEGESQTGEEVTQQHADLVARIRNDRETELRLQDILRTRTGKVKDVLEVEQEITRVRGEIEQMEAEQKSLQHRVDFGAIDLKLAEEYKARLNTPAPSALMQLRNATINGCRKAFESLLALVLFLAESGPSLVLWLVLLGIPGWRLWRRYRRAPSLGSFAGA